MCLELDIQNIILFLYLRQSYLSLNHLPMYSSKFSFSAVPQCFCGVEVCIKWKFTLSIFPACYYSEWFICACFIF